MNLFEELKRRRVFRVAGSYLVGSWIVLQVADTLFPALHLPPSTVTFVAVAVIIGFPVALLVGWVFDLTPDGIERTSGNFRFPLRGALIATVVVAFSVSGFVIVRRRAIAARLDANTVLVLPFRVSGDASIMTLREGMVDLLAARLTGEGGPRAIDPSAGLAAWRRKVANEHDDLLIADAVQVARKLGAGQLLVGNVVSSPGRVTVNASLYSSVDGRRISNADDTAVPDSTMPLVDRIVTKLLSEQAGEGHHLQALLSESLSAVRSYLDGQRLYRRGNFDGAIRYFKAALEKDSTFASAAVAMLDASGWESRGIDLDYAGAIAWKYQGRLTRVDRAFVHAFLGENYPAPTSVENRLAGLQQLVKEAPDRMEAWYLLGDRYFHDGAALRITDHETLALKAWQHATALDATFMPALLHRIDIYAERGDTAKLRRLTNFIYGKLPELKYKSAGAWEAATALGDSAWLRGLRQHINVLANGELILAPAGIIWAGLATDDLPLLAQSFVDRANTPDEKARATWRVIKMLLNIGRVEEARALAQQVRGSPFLQWQQVNAVLWYPEFDSSDQMTWARSMVGDPSWARACVGAIYLVTHGYFDVAPAITALHKMAKQVPRGVATGPAGCAQWLETARKVATNAPDARSSLARLDSMVQHGAIGSDANFALLSAREHIQLGDYQGALIALQGGSGYGYTDSPFFLERARVESQLGLRLDAIRHYQQYLRIRAHPDSLAAPIVNKARSELAALIAEPHRN